jgi:hypothetical protein
MPAVIAFIVSGLATVGALVAVLFVHGGLEAAAVGVGFLSMIVFLGLLAALGAEGDALARWR